MNTTQLATLATELRKPAYAANIAAGKWQTIADALNARATVPNPTSQPNRPKLIAWTAFLDALTNADTLKLYTYGALPDHLKAALASNDRVVTLAIWKGLKTVLAPASITAVEALANSTEADPTWSATIQQPSIAMGLGLPFVQALDVRDAARRIAGG